MGSSFMGFDIATTGLFAAQRGMTTVNHNLANVNTPGYSRQVIDQSAKRAQTLFDQTGMLGTGSEVKTVSRIRDDYYDFKFWTEKPAYGAAVARMDMLDQMERTFNEPSDVGFATVMNRFYESMQELSKDPGSFAVRALVKESAVTVCNYFNSVSTKFDEFQNDINIQVKNSVQDINSLAEQIARLSQQIYSYEVDGSHANDLRDQRGAIIDELSEYINIHVYEFETGFLPSGKPDKRLVIAIGGKPLVNHHEVSKLEVVQRNPKLNEEDIPGLYDLYWEDGLKATVTDGKVRGLMDVRDGNYGLNGDDPVFRGIPYYQRKMNDFVREFAKTINEGIIDTDGDGDDESYRYVRTDANRNGISDILEGTDPSIHVIVDTNDNGINDVTEGLVDLDGDLVPDIMIDTNSDGIDDLTQGIDVDVDGDGLADNVTIIDTNGNGTNDFHEGIDFDFDGDGTVDPIFDTNFNGINDPEEGIPTDTDGDGDLDEWKVLGHIDGYKQGSVPGDPVSEIRLFTFRDGDGNYVDSSTFIDTAYGGPYDPNTELTAAQIANVNTQYEQITAKNFSISFEIKDNYAKNVCAGDAPDEQSNNSVVQSIMNMRHNPYMYKEGSPEDFIKTIVSTIGVDNQQAKDVESVQYDLTAGIDFSRQSISGVSINEEMTLLVQFQHAYNASAKMINTVSEILDICINGLGI